MDNSLNQTTYERFKKDILTFELKPGEAVSAAKIAEKYNVSRTPAREALVKLESEGLVDIIPQSKSVISRIDLNKVRQEWFIRTSLEMGIIDDFFQKVTPEDLNRMKACNREMIEISKMPSSTENSYKYQSADNSFHAVGYEVAGQLLSLSVLSNTMAHYSRLRYLTELDNRYQNRTVSGHEKLISLLEAKDIAGYREELRIHLDHALKDIEVMKEKYPDYFVKEI